MMRAFLDYFRKRPWLLLWLSIFAIALLVLGLTGQIRLQGNGRVTPYEWGSVAIIAGVWIFYKFVFHQDLTEEYLLGLIFGIQWEFLTEPYWTYLPDKFNVLVWKDIPLLMLGGWSVSFSMSLLLSQWLGKKLFHLNARQIVFDWRVLLTDMLAVAVVGTLGEWSYGVYFGCWKYNLNFGLGLSPLGLGWEVHIGYLIVMFWYGTTFRVWKLKLEGALPIGGARRARPA
jgi:hypothetical protein